MSSKGPAWTLLSFPLTAQAHLSQQLNGHSRNSPEPRLVLTTLRLFRRALDSAGQGVAAARRWEPVKRCQGLSQGGGSFSNTLVRPELMEPIIAQRAEARRGLDVPWQEGSVLVMGWPGHRFVGPQGHDVRSPALHCRWLPLLSLCFPHIWPTFEFQSCFILLCVCLMKTEDRN